MHTRPFGIWSVVFSKVETGAGVKAAAQKNHSISGRERPH